MITHTLIAEISFGGEGRVGGEGEIPHIMLKLDRSTVDSGPLVTI